MPKQICLSNISSRSDLAAQLDVPVAAINLVSLVETTPCRTEACPLPSVAGNRQRCILCSQTWFPRDDMRYRRGHGLYGAQFLRSYGGRSSPPSACCCENALCEKIGYSHAGMFRFPLDPAQRSEAVRVLGIKSPEARKKIIEHPKQFMVAPWHYHRRHRCRKSDGSWALRREAIYRDEEGKSFPFPPPNANVQRFIDEEIPSTGLARGAIDDTLPDWFRILVRLQEASIRSAAAGDSGEAVAQPEGGEEGRAPTAAGLVRARPSAGGGGAFPLSLTLASLITPPRRDIQKRGHPDSELVVELRDELRVMKAQLESAFSRIDGLEAEVQIKNKELIEVRLERDQLKQENSHLQDLVAQLEQRKLVLSYDDLRPDGVLADHDFTHFPDFESNDAFLDLINFAEGCAPGDGLCENLVRYSTVSMEERRKYHEAMSPNEPDDMSISSDAGTDLDVIIAEAAEAEAEVEAESKRSGPQRKLSWKTEWLVYNFYVHANMKMRRVGALFGISPWLVHNIVYAWANLLCITLDKFFPAPSRSQMLRAYPKSAIKKFGHANIFLMLDATKIYTDVASMKTVNAILYSAYKHNSTLKWLAGCCPIGSFHKDSIGDAHGGSISDPFATRVSKILESIPFGMAVEVDKGFMIENDCALLGIICIRPMKKLEKQTQQSKEDTALTQKVGKTRIVIEQGNGRMKPSTSFFERRIKIQQIGLADKIFHASFLLQNFKLPFIQGRDDDAPQTDRPCLAEIRWYGATDDGLVDVRAEPELWALESELDRWHELRGKTENARLSDVKISELVLDEDWPAKLRKKSHRKYCTFYMIYLRLHHSFSITL
ncbi:hypothetical protein ACHAWF_017126 [Thalassiosira exigua]